jgi:hypothetical protein
MLLPNMFFDIKSKTRQKYLCCTRKHLSHGQREDPLNRISCRKIDAFANSFKNIMMFSNYEVYSLQVRGSAESQKYFLLSENLRLVKKILLRGINKIHIILKSHITCMNCTYYGENRPDFVIF